MGRLDERRMTRERGELSRWDVYNTCVVAMIMCACVGHSASLFSGPDSGWLASRRFGGLDAKKLLCMSLIADGNRFDMQC